MGLTYKKEEQLRAQPIIKTRVWKSKSGKHLVFQTSITEIKPVPYMEKVMTAEPLPEDEFDKIFSEQED